MKAVYFIKGGLFMKALIESVKKIKEKQESQEEMNAEILLAQAELDVKVSNIDGVLAEILLNQMEG